MGRSKERRSLCLPGLSPHNLIAERAQIHRVCAAGGSESWVEVIRGAFWRKWYWEEWAELCRWGRGYKTALTQGCKGENDLPSNYPPYSLVCTHGGSMHYKWNESYKPKESLQGNACSILPLADPGAGTSGGLPGAFTPGPPTLDHWLGPIITGLRPCPPAHSRSQAIHPGPCVVYLAFSSAPLSAPAFQGLGQRVWFFWF